MQTSPNSWTLSQLVTLMLMTTIVIKNYQKKNHKNKLSTKITTNKW